LWNVDPLSERCVAGIKLVKPQGMPKEAAVSLLSVRPIIEFIYIKVRGTSNHSIGLLLCSSAASNPAKKAKI
jgi:hypothetical protein